MGAVDYSRLRMLTARHLIDAAETIHQHMYFKTC
jgi:hypothetical protein